MWKFLQRRDQQGSAQDVDPAASMSLLNQLLANPLDAAYTHYEPDSGRLGAWHKALVVVFSCALGLASVSVVGTLRNLSTKDVEEELRSQARSKQEAVEALQLDVSALSAAAHTDSATTRSTALAPGLALANSLDPASGPGLIVTLKDSESAAVVGTNAGRVRDIDLNVVVNALWSAGAEGIAINDIRIGPGTFIRQAGSVILMNITPIQSPYVISAIGDANAMSVALVRGASGDFLSSAASVSGFTLTTAGSLNIELPALDLRVTHTVQAVTEESESSPGDNAAAGQPLETATDAASGRAPDADTAAEDPHLGEEGDY